MLLTENETEFRILDIGLHQLGLEQYQNAILEEFVVRQRIRVKALCFEIMNSAIIVSVAGYIYTLTLTRFPLGLLGSK